MRILRRFETDLPALARAAQTVIDLALVKAENLNRRWNPAEGAPVFTADGRYTARGWTEWTHGFQFGILILAGELAGETRLIEEGRRLTLAHMPGRLTHRGVHDHGFNTLSTYGQLLRLLDEGTFGDDSNPWERETYSTAIRASGAVQAMRWTNVEGGLGFIHSFNGPQSLFVDTMRTLRVLNAAHRLGHVLLDEHEQRVNLMARAVAHALVTARFLVFHGSSRHTYDVRGRTAHEGIFNPVSGSFRARSTQQGYSPFSTWSRGIAWAMLGFAEELYYLRQCDRAEIEEHGGKVEPILAELEQAATAVCDHYLSHVAAADGVPYWDDGAPGLAELTGWRERPADPNNEREPVDASAAAIAALGLLRLGLGFGARGAPYRDAALTLAGTLLSEPYLSFDTAHEGLLLHSVYHWPNRWDHVPRGARVTRGESSMWGDYHLLELAQWLTRLAAGRTLPPFWFDRKP